MTATANRRERPDPEVAAKAQRRRFTAAYKQRILEEADACTEPGQIGALLRREGLYSSSLTQWRQPRDAGTRAALSRARGRKAAPDPAPAERIATLERENERLRQRLAQAEALLEIQKKVSAVLGIPLNPHASGGSV
jgi:transposase